MAAAKRAAKEEAKAAQVSALGDALAAARSAAAADDPDGAAAALQAAGYPTEAALARAVTVATIELRKVRVREQLVVQCRTASDSLVVPTPSCAASRWKTWT